MVEETIEGRRYVLKMMDDITSNSEVFLMSQGSEWYNCDRQYM